VLNHPNDGGYLEWELSPRQQIYSDLQTPFLFSDRDIFRGDQAFQDPPVLEGLVSEYHPAFLLVPRKLAGVGTWVDRVSDFAPVFVDDASVLYASSARQPDLVARYRLTAIDPFALVVAGDATDPQVLARAAQELARANEIYPAGGRMRVFEGALALARGDTDSALRISEAVVAAHPDRWEGQRLRGDVLSRLQRTTDACQAYEAALKHTDIEGSADQTEYLQKRLWSCYTHVGRREDAYRALRAALGDLYRPSVGYQELASLALAALDAGHELEGRTLLEFALAKTPASEAELRGKLEAKLRSLAPSR
jgi:tetratricopeptide (TPR) repeat protein